MVEKTTSTCSFHIRPKSRSQGLVNSLKGVSSRMLRKERPDDLARRYWRGVLCSPSYFAASCGGAPINILREYIEQQKTPDLACLTPALKDGACGSPWVNWICLHSALLNENATC
jgi:putative transposase